VEPGLSQWCKAGGHEQTGKSQPGYKEKLPPHEEQGPREVVPPPSLEVSKMRLARALSELVEAKPPCPELEVGLETPRGPTTMHGPRILTSSEQHWKGWIS